MTVLTTKDRALLAVRNYREFLEAELKDRVERKNQYSMRAFARDLEIAASSLSTLLARKSHLARSSVYKVAFNLHKPELLESYFIYMALAEIEEPGNVNNQNFIKARELRHKYLYLNTEVPHRMLASWSLKPMALKLLLGLEHEIKTDKALQRRLGISDTELRDMLGELESIGWIKRTEKGYQPTERFVEIGNSGNAYDIRSVHDKSLSLALHALNNQTVDERSFFTGFCTLDPKELMRVSAQLRKSGLEIAELQDDSAPNQEVYILGTFLVPLTRSLE
jgi:uncharacterized protein (TIGR02147 family)